MTSPVNLECFKSKFSILLVTLGYYMAFWYWRLFPEAYSLQSKELYTSKRTIIKISQEIGVAAKHQYFSIHRRMINHDGGKQSCKWYYEKYLIIRQEEGKPRPKYQIHRYGYYPYEWE